MIGHPAQLEPVLKQVLEGDFDVADVLIDTPSGQIRVAEMKKNDFLGEIAILCDVPRTATVSMRSASTTRKSTKAMNFTGRMIRNSYTSST